MKITITEIRTELVKTQYGEKEVYRLADDKGTKYGSWKGDWNKDWMVGSVVDVDVQRKGRYLNLFPPQQTAITNDFEDACKGYFRSIMLEIQALRKQLGLPGPATKAPTPKPVEPTDDLPY